MSLHRSDISRWIVQSYQLAPIVSVDDIQEPEAYLCLVLGSSPSPSEMSATLAPAVHNFGAIQNQVVPVNELPVYSHIHINSLPLKITLFASSKFVKICTLATFWSTVVHNSFLHWLLQHQQSRILSRMDWQFSEHKPQRNRCGWILWLWMNDTMKSAHICSEFDSARRNWKKIQLNDREESSGLSPRFKCAMMKCCFGV